MKTLITDIKAALLYLSFFQITEDPDAFDHDLFFDTPEQQLGSISKDIIELGYPDPTTIIFDDDGCPSIPWKSHNNITLTEFDKSSIKGSYFSCIEFYESIDFNPNYFTI